jgi:hypothetical protein
MALLADNRWDCRVLAIVLPSSFDSAGLANSDLDGFCIAGCGSLGSGNLYLEFRPSDLQNAATTQLM